MSSTIRQCHPAAWLKPCQFAVLSWLVLATVPLANANRAAPQQDTESPAHSKSNATLSTQLDNGLRVELIQQTERVLVSASLVYDAGACREPEGKGGLAHLVEHLMFSTVTPNSNLTLKQRLRLHAVRNQGWTSPEAMAYEWACLPEEVPALLELEMQRMTGLALDEANFEREKRIALQEREYRSGLSPTQELITNCYRAAFAEHPLGRNPLGSVKSMASVSAEDAITFHTVFLRPERAVLVMVGPLAPNELLASIEETLGRVSKAPADLETHLPPLPPPEHRTAVSDRPEHAGFYVGYGLRVPSASLREQLLSEVIQELLETWVGGIRVRSFGDEQLILVYRWYSRYFAGLGMQRKKINADNDVQDALSWLWRDLKECSRHLRSDKKYEAIMERVADRLAGDGQVLEIDPTELALARMLGERSSSSTEMDSTLASIERGDCLRYLHDALDPNLAVNVVIHGAGSGRAVDLSAQGMQELRSGDSIQWEPPPPPGIETLNSTLDMYRRSGLPRIERFEMSDGTQLCAWQQPESGVFHMGGFRSFAGLRVLDASHRPGMNCLYNATIGLSSRSHGPDEDRELFELPFDTWLQASPFEFRFSAHGSPAKARDIVGSIIERLNDLALDITAWRGTLHNAEHWYEEDQVSPHRRARRFRRELVFGQDHPSLCSEICPVETIQGIEYKDLTRFHEELSSSDGLVWLASGDVDGEALGRALTGILDRNKPPKLMESRELRTELAGIEGRVFPDFAAGDARLRLSFPSMDSSRVEMLWAKWQILKSLLERSLYGNLRYWEGLAYSLWATLDLQGDRMSVQIGLTSSPKRIREVLGLIRGELSRLDDGPLEEGLFLQAKLDAVQKLINAEGDPDLAMDTLMGLARMTPSALANPMDALMGVEIEEFHAFSKMAIDPESYAFTIVGPILEDEIDSLEY